MEAEGISRNAGSDAGSMASASESPTGQLWMDHRVIHSMNLHEPGFAWRTLFNTNSLQSSKLALKKRSGRVYLASTKTRRSFLSSYHIMSQEM